MAFTFPASPATNDTYTVGSRTYTWTGSVWEMTGGLITTSQLTDLGVTTAKINDAAVTQAKLGTTLSAVTVTTTANRDTAIASPFTGQLVFLTDTKKVQVWDGASWLNITLAPPETPTSLSATALSTTSVSIAFTAGGANGSPITNYKYALSTNGGSTYGSFTALSPEDITTPITISGLTEATAYYIKLKAVNDLGDSVASSAVTITTLDTPDAPTSLSAGSITATTVVISFTPGAQGGSAISNYQYALSTNGGSTYGSFTALSPADAASPITITGLTADSSYYVKIKAVNNDGAGVESSAVSFATPAVFTAQYLVVAGGGAAGSGGNATGGGGAGGFRSTVTATGGGGSLESALSLLTLTSYTATVGAGGSATGTTGSNGSDSVFSTITSTGGGGGGSMNTAPYSGITGGSGGGGAYTGAGAAGTANQGRAGGNGSTDTTTYTSGGGGGGASGVGSNAGYFAGGAGGAGVASSITGSSVTRGGGGGGGANNGGSAGGAGAGGGAAGVNTGTGNAATVNTGGGGGGCGGGGQTGGAGGSGIVILKYPDTYTIAIGAGLTGTTASPSGGFKVTTITAGTGDVSWT